MSSAPAGIRSRHLCEAPGPPPLNPPSPDLSSSQSWKSGIGLIPIILDPSLAAGSPSYESLPLCGSSSLTPCSQTMSVGALNQPMAGRCLEELNPRLSAEVKARTKVDTASRVSTGLSIYPHNASSSPSFSAEPHSMADSGSLCSASSTSAALLPFTNDEEKDFDHAEKGSVFTLSAYLTSPSVYDDSNGDDDTLSEPTPRITSSIFHHHDQDYSSLMKLDPAARENMPGKLASGLRTPLSIGLLDLDRIDGSQHGFSASLAAVKDRKSQESVNFERHTPSASRRDVSELDVPLSPTSTFLLSPSASVSSQHKPFETANYHSAFNSQFPPRHQHTHCRAASAPLSMIYSSRDIDQFGHTTDTAILSAGPPSVTVRSVPGQRYRSVSNSHVTDTSAHLMRSSSCYKVETASASFLSADPTVLRASTRAKSPSDISKAPDWFQSISIKLWIDQEGFRSIQPKFALVEYWSGSGLSPSGRPLDVAKFSINKRQTWHFHHATLDSPPVLRRLTVNGDMNDYISRQAGLTLKHNGTYTVESTEDKGKLAWKFEYLVEDRRAPETGKIMDGEKRFTPLSFVCNPELLTPEHGKKVKLLQFVRKSVTPKLQSYKVIPPSTSVMDRPEMFAGTERYVDDTELRGDTRRNKDTFTYPSAGYSSASQANNPGVSSWSKSPVPVTIAGEGLSVECHQDNRKGSAAQKRTRCRPFSDGTMQYSIPPPVPTDGPAALSRLGQRVVSPSALHALCTVHEPRNSEFERFFPPPQRAARGYTATLS